MGPETDRALLARHRYTVYNSFFSLHLHLFVVEPSFPWFVTFFCNLVSAQLVFFNVIGAGGFGSVFLGDNPDSVRCAIKVVTSADFTERENRAIQTLMQFWFLLPLLFVIVGDVHRNKSQFIIQVYRIKDVERCTIIEMEFANAKVFVSFVLFHLHLFLKTLDSFLKPGTPLSETEAKNMMFLICILLRSCCPSSLLCHLRFYSPQCKALLRSIGCILFTGMSPSFASVFDPLSLGT
jgi:hypothetical protein